MPTTAAIVFAGGVGLRMGHATLPKQLIEVDGRPILVHTLERFQDHERIEAIYLVVGAGQIETAQALVSRFELSKVRSVTIGGATAHESIFNGLRAAVEDGVTDDSIVLIHDGVRPILPADLITESVKGVLEFGSAITSIPAHETVGISRDGNTVESVPERSEMYALQAPQSFRLGKIYEINQRAAAEGKLGTFVDQAHMMDHYNEKIHLITGIRGNIKITVPDDFLYFSWLCESGHFGRILRGET